MIASQGLRQDRNCTMSQMEELQPFLEQAGVLAIGVLIGFLVAQVTKGQPMVNQTVQKDKEKVVHKISTPDIEDFCREKGKPVCALCRCWKSKTMPYCDGSHTAHNRETGDNVGPTVFASSPLQHRRRLVPPRSRRHLAPARTAARPAGRSRRDS